MAVNDVNSIYFFNETTQKNQVYKLWNGMSLQVMKFQNHFLNVDRFFFRSDKWRFHESYFLQYCVARRKTHFTGIAPCCPLHRRVCFTVFACFRQAVTLSQGNVHTVSNFCLLLLGVQYQTSSFQARSPLFRKTLSRHWCHPNVTDW